MGDIKSINIEISQVESQMLKIIGEISRLKTNRINGSTKIRDGLGIDSFTALEILVAIEKMYKIKIAESDLENLVTFGDLVKYVYKSKSN